MKWPYLGWRGRVARATWFWGIVGLALLAVAFGLFASTLAGDAGAAIVAALFVALASALSMRRLHDIGQSGWSMAVAIVPVIGPLWLLFQLTRRGVEGRNRFGTDPLSRFDYLQVDIAR